MRLTMLVAAGAVLVMGCDGTGSGPSDVESENDVAVEDTMDVQADTASDVQEEEVTGGDCEVDTDCMDDNPCTEDLCDADFGQCTHVTWDADGDGYPVAQVDGLLCGGTDCDDTRDDVHPGAVEEGCDWVDNDCDGIAQVMDDDGDTVADATCSGTDCDDEDPFIHPGADEVCDTVDDDCDGSWADGGADDDGDGWLDAECGGDDCNDDRPSIHPGADEVCLDGIDQDCDTIVDGPVAMMADERVTYAPGTSSDPSLAWTGTGYGVTWHDDRLGKLEIYFASVTAAGAKDGGDRRVTDATGSSLSPALTWTGSEFGVAWWDTRSARDDIYFVRLDGDGAKLASEERITDEDGESWYPSVVWTGTGYGMGWYNDRVGNAEVFYARITATGLRSGSDVRITNAVDESWYPTLVWSGSEYGVAWMDLRDGNYEIYFARFQAGGTMTGSEVRVTDAPGASQIPIVAWSGSEYGITWFDRMDGNDEIYFQRVSAEGEVMGTLARITKDGGLSQHPNMVWTGSEFVVSWFDSRTGDLEIYVSRITADGEKVGDEARITDIYGLSAYPDLAWSGSEVGVAWVDHRDLNDEVYFNRIGFCD